MPPTLSKFAAPESSRTSEASSSSSSRGRNVNPGRGSLLRRSVPAKPPAQRKAEVAGTSRSAMQAQSKGPTAYEKATGDYVRKNWDWNFLAGIKGEIANIMSDAQCVEFNTGKRCGGSTESRKILGELKELRDKYPLDVFTECLLVVMRQTWIQTRKRNCAEIRRNLEDCFFYQLAKSPQDESDEQKKKEEFRNEVFTSFIGYNFDEETIVRERLVTVCNRLLDSISSVEELPEGILEGLEFMYLHRCRDLEPSVRIPAIKGLKHFQLDENPRVCEATKWLQLWAAKDPNPVARKAALESLNFNDVTMEAILKRVGDADETVREAALNYVAENVPIDKLTIDNREYVILSGLDIDKPKKIKAAGRKVVHAWLAQSGDNVIRLLSKLDVVVGRKVCYLAMDAIYDEGTVTERFRKVDLCLWGDKKLIPLKKLSNEVAVYWRYVMLKFREYPICAQVILPEVHDMCTYLKRYYEKYPDNYIGIHGPEVLEQLIAILRYAAARLEEGGRKELLSVLVQTVNFVYIDTVHVRVIMDLQQTLLPDEKKREAFFFNLMDKMLYDGRNDPLLLNSLQNNQDETVTEEPQSPSSPEDVNDSPEKKLQFGMLIHKKHKLIGQKAEALLKNDYLLAAELQTQIEQLTAKTDSLRPKRLSEAHALAVQEQANPGPSTSRAAQIPSSAPTNENEEDEEEGVIMDPSSYLPAILQFALASFLEHIIRTKRITPMIRTFYETYVPRSLLSDTIEVRRLVIHIMGAVGSLCSAEAPKSMHVCLQALLHDAEKIALTGLRAMFDMLMVYGFKVFEDAKIEQLLAGKGSTNCRESFNNSLLEEGGTSLMQHLINQLNSNNQDMVRTAAEGLMKLATMQHFGSASFVTRILTMWSNPVYAHSRIFNRMNIWVPVYAKLSHERASMIADAFVPAMRKLMYAGRESPLADASAEALAKFVASATSAVALTTFVENPENIHALLADNILVEMDRLTPSPEVATLAKSLKFINLSGLGANELEVIIKKVNRLLRVCSNNRVKQSLTAFMKHLTVAQANKLDPNDRSCKKRKTEVAAGDNDGDGEEPGDDDEEENDDGDQFEISEPSSDEETLQ